MDENEETNDVIVVLLDFPKGGTLGLDGQSIVLKTEDFVGVKNLPSKSFHLVTCKNGNGSQQNNDSSNHSRQETNTINASVPVGFLVFGDCSEGNDRHLIRKYDPQTEEVGSKEASPIDDLTKKNLLHQIQSTNHHNSSRVLLYDQIVQGESLSNQDGADENVVLTQQRVWREQTRYINESRSVLLQTIRGLSSGDKIVPGCYDPDSRATVTTIDATMDGKSLVYPPIPVVDPRHSLATHKHSGTFRFLSRFLPSERTELFLSSQASSKKNTFVWLDKILDVYYRNSWQALLGDLQLSYLMFLYLGCFSSLEHWKDLLAMLSLAVDENRQMTGNHLSLYRGLLRLLPYQLSSMTDPEFLEDIEEGGGNFLIPSLERLYQYYDYSNREKQHTALPGGEDAEEEELLLKLKHILSSKFSETFSPERLLVPRITTVQDNDDRRNIVETEPMDVETKAFNGHHFSDDDNDEDGPVVVSSEEIEASLARSYNSFPVASSLQDTVALRETYPLLAAAVMPHEDVLMTCARALDDQNDVSLVREAAAYLFEVERKRTPF